MAPVSEKQKTIADKMEVRMGVGREALVSILAVFWVPSSGIRWGQDGTKIRKNIDKMEVRMYVGRLLYRLLPNLGPILGSKMGSRWHKNQKQKTNNR